MWVAVSREPEAGSRWLRDGSRRKARYARSQRNPASLRIGHAIPGVDALLFGHSQPFSLGLRCCFEWGQGSRVRESEAGSRWLRDGSRRKARYARSQRIPASLRIGHAIRGVDALLFGHSQPFSLGLRCRFEWRQGSRERESKARSRKPVAVSRSRRKARYAQSQRIPASLRIGHAIPGVDALLFGHSGSFLSGQRFRFLLVRVRMALGQE